MAKAGSDLYDYGKTITEDATNKTGSSNKYQTKPSSNYSNTSDNSNTSTKK